jgi:hypothetical protein
MSGADIGRTNDAITGGAQRGGGAVKLLGVGSVGDDVQRHGRFFLARTDAGKAPAS